MSTLIDSPVTMPTTELRYLQAVNAALSDALDLWPESMVFGEDIATPGGVFGATKGLLHRFPGRVFDTPISEAAILGTGVGVAIEGFRPIVEIMWADFSLVALDQIFNQASNINYVSLGRQRVPMTVRMQQGATPGSCAQHSQNLEWLFAARPGLVVAMPSTPQDAYDTLLTSISLDGPAIVIESRALYGTQKSPVHRHREPGQPGQARTVQRGDDVTVVSWGPAVHLASTAVRGLAEEGISVDLIDLRWLRPWDTQAVLDSMRRTGRLLVVHDGWRTGGFGAEVVSHVVEHAFADLRRPPIRLGGGEAPMPAAPHLQRALLPSADQLSSAVRRLVA